MRNSAAALVCFILALAFAVAPVHAGCPEPTQPIQPSWSLSANMVFTPTQLACNCTIQIFIEPGADILIDLPAADAMGKSNPIIMIGANNAAAFTVTSDGVTVLNHFTTRGTVGFNGAAGKWVRLQ